VGVALKKLDKLTTEEARMATAQVLKATHGVGDRMRGVEDKVLDVDNRVAGVDDKVASVDNRVAGVDDRVAGVDDRVAGVDDRVAGVDNRVENVEVRVASVDETVRAVEDKVAVVIDGAQLSSIGHQKNIVNPHVSRGKGGKGSHSTDCNRCRSSETFVILSALTRVLGVHAQEPPREPVATGPPQMALSVRSVYKPQHCVWCSPQENSPVVFPRQYLHGMEIHWFAFVASRKTYVPSNFQA
jgi:hypothetical protein